MLISVIILYSSVRGAGHIIPQTAVSCFPGFLPAIEACALNWKNVDLGIILPEEKVLQVSHPLTLRCARICHPESGKDVESGLEETSPNVAAPLDEKGLDQLYWLIEGLGHNRPIVPKLR